MRPPITTAQRKVLRSMLGLLQALVTENETNILKLDRCLVLISELPTTRSMMGEEDDKVDGTENEQVFVYFKGVAMLLRGLLDSMGEEGEGDKKADAFLIEIAKIFSEVFPELTARDTVQEIALQETAAKVEVEVEVSEQPACVSVKEESQDEDLNEGHESLSQRSIEHTNDHSTNSKHTTDPVDSSTIIDSDEDLNIASESRSRKRLLAASPSWSTKRFRSERQYVAPDNMTARKVNFYKAAILQEKQRRKQFKQHRGEQQKEKQKALEEGLQKAQQQAEELRILELTNKELFSGLQILDTRTISSAESQKPHDKAAVQVSMASEVIRRLLGTEGIKQQSKIDYISDLIQFCRKCDGSDTALDWFGANLARSELDRACSSESQSKFYSFTAEAKRMMAFRIRHGRKLRILADAFGIGILAFIPQNPLIPLQGVEEAELKYVVDSISTTKALYPRIKNVSEKARQMMFIAIVGNSEKFERAANEVLMDLKNFYPRSRTTDH
ncbi:MAG: hypothetical protein Q9195_007874 [Heterodermia aff. obscurata]